MKTFTVSTILALSALRTCSASIQDRHIKARQTTFPIATFFFGGYDEVGVFFRQSVPEDGKTYPITNNLDVYTIIADDTLSNCTFVSADGSVYGLDGYQIDVVPGPLKSVTCDARTGPISTASDFPNFSIFFPTVQTALTTESGSTTASASASLITSSTASTVPPYPTGTGPRSTVGPTGSSAPAPSSTTNPIGGNATVPFTGDAARGIRSLGLTILAFLGLIGTL